MDARENDSVDLQDEKEFEHQRSFFAKLLFSDDSADDDDFLPHNSDHPAPT